MLNYLNKVLEEAMEEVTESDILKQTIVNTDTDIYNALLKDYPQYEGYTKMLVVAVEVSHNIVQILEIPTDGNGNFADNGNPTAYCGSSSSPTEWKDLFSHIVGGIENKVLGEGTPTIVKNCPVCGSQASAEGIHNGLCYVYPPMHCTCGWSQRCPRWHIKDCMKCTEYHYCLAMENYNKEV